MGCGCDGVDVMGGASMVCIYMTFYISEMGREREGASITVMNVFVSSLAYEIEK